MEKRFPDFAVRFTLLRGNMTQAQFADFLGMSRPTIGFYESGTRIPDALGVRTIAEKCHVSADWLLGLSDVKAPNGDLQQVCNYTGLSESSAAHLRSLNKDLAITASEYIDNQFFDEIIEAIHVLQTMYFCNWCMDEPATGRADIKDDRYSISGRDYEDLLLHRISRNSEIIANSIIQNAREYYQNAKHRQSNN